MHSIWAVPKEWVGDRCLIICGGESVLDDWDNIKNFKGRIIAIKQAIAIRPDADVMFISGKDDGEVCKDFFSMFRGKYIVARGPYKGVPDRTKVLKRTKDATELSMDPTEIAGYDAGTSAINLASLFGSMEILLTGFDMRGGRWLNGRYRHHQPFPPQRDFDIHMSQLPKISEALNRIGVKVFNCSMMSAVTAFEKKSLKEFM